MSLVRSRFSYWVIVLIVVIAASDGEALHENDETPMPEGVPEGEEQAVYDLREEMREDERQLDQLKERLFAAIALNDERTIRSLEQKANKLFNDLQMKFDIFSQIYKVTKEVELDMDAISDKWPEFFKENKVSLRRIAGPFSNFHGSAPIPFPEMKPRPGPPGGPIPFPELPTREPWKPEDEEAPPENSVSESSLSDDDDALDGDDISQGVTEAAEPQEEQSSDKDDENNNGGLSQAFIGAIMLEVSRFPAKNSEEDQELLNAIAKGAALAKQHEEEEEEEEDFLYSILYSTVDSGSRVDRRKRAVNELKALLVSKRATSCPGMPESNWLSGWVSKKETSSNLGRECAKSVKDKAKEIRDALNDFHNIAQEIAKLKQVLSGLDATLIPLSRAPLVGGTASTAKTAIAPLKRAVDKLDPPIQRLDRRLNPRFKDHVERARVRAEQVEGLFSRAFAKCLMVRIYLDRTVNCLCRTSSSYKNRGQAMSIMENLSKRIKQSPYRNTADQVYTPVTGSCRWIELIHKNLMTKLNMPQIRSFLGALRGLMARIGPMADIFREIEIAFNKELCVINPVEVAREAAERTAELAKQGAEKTREQGENTRELANAVSPVEVPSNPGEVVDTGKEVIGGAVEVIGGGWRRKRSISGDVFISREKASGFLLNRNKRSGKICIKVIDILNGVSAVFNLILGEAQKLINGLLSKVPGFNGLGLPGFNMDFDYFDRLDLNIDITIPSFDIDWKFLDLIPPANPLPGNLCPNKGQFGWK